MTHATTPDLDRIAIRVQRNGRWASAFIGELDYLDALELQQLTWAHEAITLLEADPSWRYHAPDDRWTKAIAGEIG